MSKQREIKACHNKGRSKYMSKQREIKACQNKGRSKYVKTKEGQSMSKQMKVNIIKLSHHHKKKPKDQKPKFMFKRVFKENHLCENFDKISEKKSIIF